jgi:hypothetical protein
LPEAAIKGADHVNIYTLVRDFGTTSYFKRRPRWIPPTPSVVDAALSMWVVLERKKRNSLPLRCDPIDGESLNGFIARLAKENGFHKVAWVAEIAEIPFPQRWYGDDDIERLASVAGRDFGELRAIAATLPHPKGGTYVSSMHGRDVPTGVFVRDVRRLCPRCLEISAYHPAIWEMRFVRSCVDHGGRLLAACPTCKRQLDWRTDSVCLCSCGFDLRTAETVAVPEEALVATRFLQAALLGTEQAVPTLLEGLDFEEIFWLLWRFGRQWSGGISAILDDSVDPDVEHSLTRGLTALSRGSEELERDLNFNARRWSSFPAKKTIAFLEEVQGRLKEMSPKAEPLAEIVRRVLEDPPPDPPARAVDK